MDNTSIADQSITRSYNERLLELEMDLVRERAGRYTAEALLVEARELLKAMEQTMSEPPPKPTK